MDMKQTPVWAIRVEISYRGEVNGWKYKVSRPYVGDGFLTTILDWASSWEEASSKAKQAWDRMTQDLKSAGLLTE